MGNKVAREKYVGKSGGNKNVLKVSAETVSLLLSCLQSSPLKHTFICTRDQISICYTSEGV